MVDATSDVQNIFSSIANKYDSLNTILSFNIDKTWREKAIKMCNLKEGHKVLDLCCGTGQMVDYACRTVGKNTEVIGLDFNEEMIHVGYKRLDESIKDYRYRLIKGNILELPFGNNSFDCITIAFGLRNVKDKRKALKEMHRVLKTGGRIICLELSKPEMAIVKNIYNIYFNHIFPFIGYLGTRDKKAYYYLRDSVNNFMTKTELKLEFDNIGFYDTGYKSLTLGTASIHYGTK